MKKILKCVECSNCCELIVDLTENNEDYFWMKCNSNNQYWKDITELRKMQEDRKLPDWCKVEAIGYDNEQKRYFEIIHIKKQQVAIEYLDDNKGAICSYMDMQKYFEAVKRPFNAEEIQNLIGKVLENPDNKNKVLITGFRERKGNPEIYMGCGWYDTKYIMLAEYTIDSKPCYVLEHLNGKGEWVK